MRYKGIDIKIFPDSDIIRKGKNGEEIHCEGFFIQLFADDKEKVEIANFTAAMDFEILSIDIEEVVQFAEDVVDAMRKDT